MLDFSTPSIGTDLKIVCENDNNQALYFSRFCLIHSSEYFRALLSPGFKEGSEQTINLDKPKEIINHLLNHIIGKTPEISKENVIDLFMISDEYLIDSLKNLCINFVMTNYYSIDPGIAFWILIDSGKSGRQKLESEYYSYNETKIKKIITSPVFGKIEENLYNLIGAYVNKFKLLRDVYSITKDIPHNFKERIMIYFRKNLETDLSSPILDDSDYELYQLLVDYSKEEYVLLFNEYVTHRYILTCENRMYKNKNLFAGYSLH